LKFTLFSVPFEPHKMVNILVKFQVSYKHWKNIDIYCFVL